MRESENGFVFASIERTNVGRHFGFCVVSHFTRSRGYVSSCFAVVGFSSYWGESLLSIVYFIYLFFFFFLRIWERGEGAWRGNLCI